MKLYAQITGIRLVEGKQKQVVKGQGSVAHMVVHVLNEERVNFATIEILPDETLIITSAHGDATIKGKKQKGECEYGDWVNGKDQKYCITHKTYHK